MSTVLAVAVLGLLGGLPGDALPAEVAVELETPVVGTVAVSTEEGVAVSLPAVGTLEVPCRACPEPVQPPAPPAPVQEPSVYARAAQVATSPQGAGAAAGAAGLLAALAWLAPRLLALLPLSGFSRIEDADLARHPARRLALQFIEANPGANVQQVRRALGLAWGTTIYHLARLEQGGLVAVRHLGGQRTHWPLGQAPPRDALPPACQALVRLVQEEPGLAQGDLARRAGLRPAAACKHLARLEEAGLLVGQRDGRLRRYVGSNALAVAA